MTKLKDPLDFLTRGRTYRTDEELFRRLGLKLFDVEGMKKTEVGTVKLGGSTVRIWVECTPAQFWTFEVFCDETRKTTTISTGSGALSDYWPTAEGVATGMICFDGEKV